MEKNKESGVSYSQFACIGAGFAGIALGATLKRWYGIDDIRIFERHPDLGGTWFANKYPGCACDVPSIVYSLSFAPNPAWSRSLATADELWEYMNKVAADYDLRPKMVFKATVEKCQWIEEAHRWRLTITDGDTNEVYTHEAQFLYSGSGLLVHPRKINIPGLENFQGPVFHSSQWRHDVDLQDKEVALIGNGCTAAQILPAVKDKTRHITQFIRSKQWIIPPLDVPTNSVLQTIYRYSPPFQAFVRFVAFLATENEVRGFFNTKDGLSFRASRRAKAVRYMKSMAPEKYHDLLIPDFDIGCKRRIFDGGYLEALHSDKVGLTTDPIAEVVHDGVRTQNGFTKADVVVLATGFETNAFCTNIEIVGRDGVNAEDHWREYGGGAAYNSTSMAGFPNFFLILGPNTATGHTSTLLAIENSINFSLRIIKPILQGRATAVDVKREAEDEYVQQIQTDLGKTVFSSGCVAWYTRARYSDKPYNATNWPYSQPYFWYKCLFPTYEHFKYDNWKGTSTIGTVARTLVWAGVFATAGGIGLNGWYNGWDFNQYLSFLKVHVSYLQRGIKF